MIINVGGRTDIVNYYSEWLINRINEGFVYSRNPLFPQKISRYDLSPEKIDCIIFCSKNYKPILKHMKEIKSRYRIICHYTITAYGKDVEPNVPNIDDSIDTLMKLSNVVGKEKVIWRYDPLLLTKKYTVEILIDTFEYIASKIHNNISFALFSFVEMYKKLEFNMPEIMPFTEEDKIKLVKEIGKIAKKYNIRIQTCGTDIDYTKYGIRHSGCTTTEILEKANGVKYKNIKKGKVRKGCHCIPTRDIGAYDTCINGCKYCYANKRPEIAKDNYKLHNPNSPILIGQINKDDIIKEADQRSFIIECNNEEQISLI